MRIITILEKKVKQMERNQEKKEKEKKREVSRHT